MTNFKLTDENGVEWVKLEAGVVVPPGARIEPACGALYIHPNDLPKPKDRFEEMAEKAMDCGPERVVFCGLDRNPLFSLPSSDKSRAGCEVVRHMRFVEKNMNEWFVAHTRKIDADATERERKAERERCIKALKKMAGECVFCREQMATIEHCIAELSKP